MSPRLFAGVALLAAAQLVFAQGRDDWRKPFPGHRVIGNLYYVGTYDLAAFLVTGSDGHMLINTGLADSTPLIRRSVESLGFRFGDIKLLLTMQAHYDHVAALAEIKRLTGAKMLATQGDKGVLEDGGKSDYLTGIQGFEPLSVDRVIGPGETIELGDVQLNVHLTPGHTKGSVSYTLKVSEDGRDYDVCIANMGSVNPGVKLIDNELYPPIAEDYAATFEAQKKLSCEIWVAAHASQYGLHTKFRPGYDYTAETFFDPEGYRRTVARHEGLFREKLAAQQ